LASAHKENLFYLFHINIKKDSKVLKITKRMMTEAENIALIMIKRN